MRKTLSLTLLWMLAGSPLSVATEDFSPPPGVNVIHDVEIGTGGGRTLHADIAWPQNPPQRPMPAVIYVHGGCWETGS